MPKELIAPDREQVAFREYASPPLEANQIRVKSTFGAAKHGTEMSIFRGYAGPRGRFDGDYRVFAGDNSGISYPCALGNMCVGTVTEMGDQVTRLEVGDVVFRYAPLRQEHVWEETVRQLPAV